MLFRKLFLLGFYLLFCSSTAQASKPVLLEVVDVLDQIDSSMEINQAQELLLHRLSKYNISMNTSNNAISINMDSDVLFDFDKHQLKNESIELLTPVARFITDKPKYFISIIGHTDSTGTDEYNLHLSKMRALSVYTFFLELGVPSYRLSYIGRGETTPVKPNTTDLNRKVNRRVELIIYINTLPENIILKPYN